MCLDPNPRELLNRISLCPHFQWLRDVQGEEGLVAALHPLSYHEPQLPYAISNGFILIYSIPFMFSEQLGEKKIHGYFSKKVSQAGKVFHNILSELQLEGATEGYFP